MSKSSLEAAAEAAAKVNAMLIAKGKLKLSTSQIKPKIGNNVLGRAKGGDLVTAEIDINDAPLSARNLLTRGHMQDEICKDSGAAISTRGRYMTPEERQNIATPECRPLYLNLQASDYRAVKIAVRKILEIIDHHVTLSGKPKSPTVGVVTYPSTGANGIVNAVPNHQNSHIPSGTHFVQDKVFVGLEQAPPDYPVRDKILGPAGSFLQHIRTETGATVTLRGKGSGFIEPTSGREAFEPLYIHITHPKPEGLQAAKALAINLVETAHVEFATWQQTQQSVLQPLTSVVLPQPAPVAYQNQVVVTPTVLPGALPAGTGVVATGIQIPSSVPGTMTAGIPSLMHANVPTLVSPVSVASIVPVSVQGKITHLAQPVQQTPTSMVMTITEPTNYPITSRYMQLSQMQSEMAKHRYYGSIDVSAVNRIQPNCLQESNVNHPTELQSREEAGRHPSEVPLKDRELMPPPLSMPATSPPHHSIVRKNVPNDEGPQKKKLKGALVGLASMYGSDDSDDNEDEGQGLPTSRQ
ncbi:KH homology domain-containing protein 4 [Parasteatoda tepidariorum]|uniref:KH homology domain-containing protein 4 n=1 Tax=Parasteatoda tepidariorum TaxID=114398 RepID=UPI0039BD63A2